ncbi:MAG: glutamine--fructose-6-phosphate transaminase (isomerizing) [Alphaproteobacteria bacterium]
MCGIIGIIGKSEVSELLVDGLRRLEYRGYDSTGIATLSGGELQRRRASGKIVNLEKVISEQPISGTMGIGHTRWATHGVPSENNAHPHMNEQVAVVHNGIIENYRELADGLGLTPSDMESETDTEIIVHLLTSFLNAGKTPLQAVQEMLPKLKGAFALCMIFKGHENIMIGARVGSPLAIGLGDGEKYFGSDALALAPYTQDICYLNDGDYVVATNDNVEIYDIDNNVVDRPVVQTGLTGDSVGKGNFRHYMEKEIHEQPTVIGDTLASYIHPAEQSITIPDLGIDFSKVEKVTISACGTAYYAGLIAKYWIEKIARIPVEIDVASEMRYREPPMPKNGVAIFVSQSGETMDTLEALKYCKSQGQKIISVVNVLESTIARESDAVLQTLAGPEIGVASTKAFTTQLTVLMCMALSIGKSIGKLSAEDEKDYVSALLELPATIAEVLTKGTEIQEISNRVAEAKDVLFLGRGVNYPIAMEGALKLKEISYIHAEGYPAGEMKHGPIALIDDSVPIIATCPNDDLFEKTAGNIQEAIARGGKVVFMSDEEGIAKMRKLTTTDFDAICIPTINQLVAPILYSVPAQLLAYYCALAKGTDVDQPRNLAKSVTVE